MLSRYLRSLTLTFLLVFFLSSSVWGQLNFFSRYYADQKRRSVVIEPVPRLLSQAENGILRLSEQEAISMALQNNLSINVERYGPIARWWSLESSKQVYDPTARFNWNWDRERVPTSSALQGGDSLTNIIASYQPSYSQQFSTGTSFDINFRGTRSKTTNFFSSLVPAIDTSFEVLFRQNLLEGFGRISPDYQIEIARNNLNMSEEEFRRQASEVIFQVQQNYWELRYADEDIEVKRKALEAAQMVLDQNQARFEVGRDSRLNVAQAEAEAALRQEQLTRAEHTRQLIQNRLIVLISTHEDPETFQGRVIPADALEQPPSIEEPFDRLQRIAEEMRPELQQFDLEIENRRVNLDLSRNRLRPTLDLVAGYQQFGLGGRRILRDFSQGFTNPQILDILPGGLGDSLDQLFSSDYYGYVVGLELTLPISNTGARAENAEAQIAYERGQMSRKQLRQQVSLEIREALTQIEMNEASISSGQAAVTAAQERLDAEQARFEVGAGTTRELIEAQRDLEAAETLLARAKVNLIQSHAALDRALGRTFASNNIELKNALETNVNGPQPE